MVVQLQSSFNVPVIGRDKKLVLELNSVNVPVIWRDKKLVLELNSEASLRELGEELRHLTSVKADTMKLIIPQSSTKASKLFLPFSNEHSCLKLKDIHILQGKPLRMMGVSESEADQLLKEAKVNLRIAGFEDEEKRMKQRASMGPQFSLKLPEGPYIFCGFRTLELPGIELNPPASEALKRMHMLVADPGIVAIMKKHRWRVGIMTEMAPEGYVGVSPVCLLGLNKNHGEEISLRLRTDDLKGFRKYESIKKTLLHELAHMVYSEHDSDFYALDRQLNQEAFALDWTRSKSHTLSDARFSGVDDMDINLEPEKSLPHKLGGDTSHIATSARAASAAAAYHRWVESFNIHQDSSACKSQDSDNTAETPGNSKQLGAVKKEEVNTGNQCTEYSSNQEMLEPDSDDVDVRENMKVGPCSEAIEEITQTGPNCADSEMMEALASFTGRARFGSANLQEKPYPDGLEAYENRVAAVPVYGDYHTVQIEPNRSKMRNNDEPDPDDFEAKHSRVQIENNITGMRMSEEPDPDDSNAMNDSKGDLSPLRIVNLEQDPDDSKETRIGGAPSNPADEFEHLLLIQGHGAEEPDPDDQEIRRIQDPVIAFSNKLTEAIKKLHIDLCPSEANMVLQTLFKIIRNITENPSEMKFKKLWKANPIFQRSIAYHKAARDALSLIGFVDDIIIDETGKSEAYLVLKRNDPALLWLAKSIIENCKSCQNINSKKK